MLSCVMLYQSPEILTVRRKLWFQVYRKENVVMEIIADFFKHCCFCEPCLIVGVVPLLKLSSKQTEQRIGKRQGPLFYRKW